MSDGLSFEEQDQQMASEDEEMLSWVARWRGVAEQEKEDAVLVALAHIKMTLDLIDLNTKNRQVG